MQKKLPEELKIEIIKVFALVFSMVLEVKVVSKLGERWLSGF